MNDTREVAARQADALQREARRIEYVLRPAADIFEDKDGVTVQMDVPGASKDGLELQVDGDRLDVEAELKVDVPEGMQALYADVRTTRYARSFSLGAELESDRIEASLRDGVLTLRIPKRAEVRPRRIEVRGD